MHGASREDLPRAVQILSAALIRVLPDGFLLKAIVLRYVNMNIPPPLQLSPLAYGPDLMSYVLPVITRAARFCSFSSLSKRLSTQLSQTKQQRPKWDNTIPCHMPMPFETLV